MSTSSISKPTHPNEKFSSPSPLKILDLNDLRLREKKLIRKVDLRMSILIPLLVLFGIDLGNISFARIGSLEKDLHLVGAQFPSAVSVGFVGFILIMVPANTFLIYVNRPSLLLSSWVVVSGLITLCTGLTKNYVGILTCRFFLGFSQGCFVPGSYFMLAAWYKQEELGLRNAIAFAASYVTGAFSSLIATGLLTKMDGKLGLAGWRWLFIIEGGATMAVALVAMFIIPDLPHHHTTQKWLDPSEVILARTRKDEEMETFAIANGAKSDVANILISTIRNGKVWWLAGISFFASLGASCDVYFPTLTRSLGYNLTLTLLLCAPPYVFIAAVAVFCARYSDKTQSRSPFLIFFMTTAIVGFIIPLCVQNKAARYVALFLMQFSRGCVPILVAWDTSLFARSEVKGIVLAFTGVFYELGSVAGSYIFPLAWGPSYRNSFGILIAMCCVTLTMIIALRVHLRVLNKRAEEAERLNPGEQVFKYIL